MYRIQKAIHLLESLDLEALIIDRPIDIFYLIGKHLSLGRLVVTRAGGILYVDGRYFEGCKKNARS